MENPKKILIFGASGFAGQNLVEYFNNKFPVLAPSHAELDLLDFGAVEKYLKQNDPDVVIYAAGVGISREQKNQNNIFKNNLKMFETLSDLNDLYGKMIFLGSGAEYDKSRSLKKVKEEEFGECLPKDEYGLAKYKCSQIIETKENIINFRLFGLYGKYEDYSTRFISNVICRALLDLPVTVVQDVKFDYLFINDFARIVEFFILNNAKQKFYNVGTGQPIGLLEILNALESIHGKKIKIIINNAGQGGEYSCNNSRLMAEWRNFQFTPFDLCLKELYTWYADNLNLIDKSKLLFDK